MNNPLLLLLLLSLPQCCMFWYSNAVTKSLAGMKNERLMESALAYASFAASEMKKKSHLTSRI